MTENRWGGILQSRNIKELAEEFRKNLAAKMAGVESAEALNLLYEVREELRKEISAGRRIPAEVGKLIEKLQQIHVADELQSSMESFLQLVAELYTTRSSVSSTFILAQSFYDRLITTAINHAVTLLKNEGREITGLTYAVLVSGELGRAESVKGSRSHFFFIYRETGETDHEYFNELAMRFMAVLSICFPDISRSLNSPSFYWFGSDLQWGKTAAGLLQVDEPETWGKTGGKSFALFIELAADMRIICGDPDFGQNIISTDRKLLSDSLHSESFRHLAKDTATMPVALGVFGRFKTVRTGENKGKINLKELAIDPLAAAVRILALASNSEETTFTCRIKAILAAGNMGVSLADQLLIAYHDFMRERIRLELADSDRINGLFFDPELLDDASRERFRKGMEEITTLQRLVYKQIVEVE